MDRNQLQKNQSKGTKQISLQSNQQSKQEDKKLVSQIKDIEQQIWKCMVQKNYSQIIDFIDQAIQAYKKIFPSLPLELQSQNNLHQFLKKSELLLQTKIAVLNQLSSTDSLSHQEKIVSVYDQILNIFLQYEKDKQIIYQKKLKKAAYLELIGNKDQAISIYSQILSSDPNFIQARLSKGNLLMDLNKFEQAFEEFDQSIRQKEDEEIVMNKDGLKNSVFIDPIYYCDRAQSLIKLQRLSRAEIDLSKAHQRLNFNQQNNFMCQDIRLIFQNIEILNCQLRYMNEQRRRQEEQKKYTSEKLTSAYQHSQSQDNKRTNIQYIRQARPHHMLPKRIKRIKPSILPEILEKLQYLEKKVADYEILLNKHDQKIENLQGVTKLLREQIQQMKTAEKILQQQLTHLKNNPSLNEKTAQLIVLYSKSFFWLLNSYFLTFRVVKSEMVKTSEESIWQSKLGSTISYVKRALESITGFVPLIQHGAEIITKICGIYLEGQAQLFNEKIYKFLTSCYTSQSQLNNSISGAILELIKSQYIEGRVTKLKQQTPSTLRKAKEWFQLKKKQIYRSVSKLRSQTQEYNIDRFVEEDVADIFAYIALRDFEDLQKLSKKGQQQTSQQMTFKQLNSNTLILVVKQALIEKDELNKQLIKKLQKDLKDLKRARMVYVLPYLLNNNIFFQIQIQKFINRIRIHLIVQQN